MGVDRCKEWAEQLLECESRQSRRHVLDIVRDMIRDVVDIKTEEIAGNVHGRRLKLSHFRNGDIRMKNSKHFAILKRNKTGSIVRHPIRSDELSLIYTHGEMIQAMLEVEYPGFHVQYFEQVGGKRNESDS
mgnify:FL=1